MELPDKIEEAVHQVETRSSTKNRIAETKNSRKSKSKWKSNRNRKEPESDPSDSQQSDEPRGTQPVATLENRVGTSRLPEDISEEVRQDLTRSGLPTQLPRVRFDDTLVFIEPERKTDDYDIIQDIKYQKANVTIGQLLHDNANYQKLIREAWIKRRKQRVRLPSVAVNFSQVEDYGALELTVEIDGVV